MNEIKTPAQIANDIASDLSKNGTIQFAGLDRSPNEHELIRAIVRRAVEADRAQRTVPQLLADDLESQAAQWADAEANGSEYRFAAQFLRDNDGNEQAGDVIGSVLEHIVDVVQERVGVIETDGNA